MNHLKRPTEILLRKYNKEYGTQHTPKSFFHEVFVPTLFTDETYPTYAINNKLTPTREFPSIEGKKNKFSRIPLEERVKEFEDSVKSGDKTMISIIGGTATAENAISHSSFNPIDYAPEDDIAYSSFISTCLGFKIKGGNQVLIHDEEVIWFTFNVWQYFVELTENKNGSELKNGQLLNLTGILLYRATELLEDGFENVIDALPGAVEEFSREIPVYTNTKIPGKKTYLVNGEKKKRGVINLQSVKWQELFFGLSKIIEDRSVYCELYNVVATEGNYVYGTFKFKSGEFNRLLDFERHVYSKNEGYRDKDGFQFSKKDLKEIYGSRYSRLEDAIQMSSLGLYGLDISKKVLRDKKMNRKLVIKCLTNLIKEQMKIRYGSSKFSDEMVAISDQLTELYVKLYKSVVFNTDNETRHFFETPKENPPAFKIYNEESLLKTLNTLKQGKNISAENRQLVVNFSQMVLGKMTDQRFNADTISKIMLLTKTKFLDYEK